MKYFAFYKPLYEIDEGVSAVMWTSTHSDIVDDTWDEEWYDIIAADLQPVIKQFPRCLDLMASENCHHFINNEAYFMAPILSDEEVLIEVIPRVRECLIGAGWQETDKFPRGDDVEIL